MRLTDKNFLSSREIYFYSSHLAWDICTGIVEFVDSDRVTRAEGGGGGGAPRVVLVQLVQMVDGQQDAEAVDEDPDDVEDIMSVGSLTTDHHVIINY